MEPESEGVESATIVGECPGGWEAISGAGVRMVLPAAAVVPVLRPRPGQSVKVASEGGRVTRVWI